MKFDACKRKLLLKSIISHSFDELHCSLKVHTNHIKQIFLYLPFYSPMRSLKITNNFFSHFFTGLLAKILKYAVFRNMLLVLAMLPMRDTRARPFPL